MSKQLADAVTWMLAACSAFASEERSIEVAQPIVTEDAIYLSRVTFVTYSDLSWAGLVDYVCQESFVVKDCRKSESRNAASIAGIKTWVDPYHFQEQALFGDTVRVYIDLTAFDASRVGLGGHAVVSATLECFLVNATASMIGWDQAANDWLSAKHLYVEIRGSPEYARLTRTYKFTDLVGKVLRVTRFE